MQLPLPFLFVLFLICGIIARVEASAEEDEDARKIRVCQQYCGYCVITYGKDNYNGLQCFNDCRETVGTNKDENCENEEYHTVKRKKKKFTKKSEE